MQPEPPPSPAALDVRAELERFARQYPEASAPALARRYIQARLKRRER